MDCHSAQNNSSATAKIEWRISQKYNDDICLPLCLLFIIWRKIREGGGADQLFWASSGKVCKGNHQGLSDPSRPRNLGRIPCLYGTARTKVSQVRTLLNLPEISREWTSRTQRENDKGLESNFHSESYHKLSELIFLTHPPASPIHKSYAYKYITIEKAYKRTKDREKGYMLP